MVDFSVLKIKNYNDIPGKISEEQCLEIIEIAKSIPKNSTVIEIGCAWGKSSWAWMHGLPSGTRFISIDPFKDDIQAVKQKELKKQRDLKKDNPVILSILKFWESTTVHDTITKVLKYHPKRQLIDHQIFCGTSDEFDISNIDRLACVYIDGDHTYDYVTNDLEKYGSISEIICGDDYKPLNTLFSHKPLVGVVHAVNDYSKKTNRTLSVNLKSSFWKLLLDK